MSFKLYLAAGIGCTVLAGAALAAPAGLTVIGAPAASSAVSFEVALPLRNTDKLDALLKALQDPASPQYHHWLSPAQFGLRFGPDSATVNRVGAALRARGFAVENHTRSLHVTGVAAQVEGALGTKLVLARSRTARGGQRLVADGALRLPQELADAGAVVMSFGRQEAHVQSQRVTDKLDVGTAGSGVDNRTGNNGTYWYNDLKQAYQYPSYETMVTVNGTTQRLDGTGATIGVLMSSDILDSDIAAVFDHEGFSTTTGKPDPTLFDKVHINGGGGVDGGAFDEAALDTQEELTGAPGAHVILYDIPDLSDGNIFAGYTQAVEENRVDLLSSSFGGCELAYFPKYNGGQDYTGVLKAYHELFVQGNAQGITFLASSGDRAGKECPNLAYFNGEAGHFVPSISNPASDPNVTAVGGTNVQTVYIPGSLDSAYAGENAWSDPEIPYDVYGFGQTVSGGVWGAGSGTSRLWTAPAYQSLVTTNSTMRSIPDIGMQVGGCPGGIAKTNPKTGRCQGGDKAINGNGNSLRSAVVVALDVGQGGGFYGLIGTSVSSPELAGALALLIEQKGRQGNLNDYIYKIAAKQYAEGAVAKYLHTKIPGYNGIIPSNISDTYNASTGVGTPVVKMFVGAAGAKPAGIPRSASNP